MTAFYYKPGNTDWRTGGVHFIHSLEFVSVRKLKSVEGISVRT